MSRIDELIAEHCPNGVEFRTLHEVAQIDGRNVAPSSMECESVTLYSLPSFDHARRPELLAPSSIGSAKTKLERPAVLVAKLNPHIPRVWRVEQVGRDSFCSTEFFPLQPTTSQLEIGYLYYFILSRMSHLAGSVTGSTNSHKRLHRQDFLSLRIPVPPLEVQREIVRVLDTFTQLEAELEAELEARRRQYEYYRLEIIHGLDAPRVLLSALGQWRGGITPSKANQRYWDAGTIPWVASMDVSASEGREIRGKVTKAALDETSLRIIPGPTVVVVMRSNILRRSFPIGIVSTDVTVNQDIRALVPRPDIDVGYVYEALRAAREDIRATCVRTDGSMAAVDSRAFLDFQIPLPPLDQQQRVADKLRHFDSMVHDISVGLPAELAARRQQYEYYRDRLLTFKEAVS